MKTNRVLKVRECFSVIIVGVMVSFCATALGIDNPDSEFIINAAASYSVETYTVTAGASEPNSGCWQTAIDRDGSDGGQLTVKVDGCQVGNYTVYSKPQGSGAGYIADLEPGDIFIEWDEDSGHGSVGYFEFTGEYISERPSYVDVTTTDGLTNWTVHRVTESGTLSKTAQGNDMNEHDAIHFQWVDLWKTDDVNDLDCVSPGDELTYTICWAEPNSLTLENVKIIDYLPEGVTCLGGNWSTDPNTGMPCWIDDPAYDPNTHTYTWEIGTLEPNDIGCVSLTVTVNERTAPGMKLYNVAELVSDGVVFAQAFEETLVCCWDTVDPNIIYVDKDATGFNNGTNWDDAHIDLRDAFYRAADSNCAETFSIHVAQGTYSPGYEAGDTYAIPDGVKLFGGFDAESDQRNIDLYESVLMGEVDANSVDAVVTMGDDTLLDGFTVTKTGNYGVYGSGADFTVRNCNVTDNQQRGIYAQDGDLTVKWCSVSDNGWHGIYHRGDGFSLIVENSQIKWNEQHGIYTINSIPTVKNSIISSNGSVGQIYYGINIVNPADDSTLHNNTIVYNAIEGISFVDNGDIGGDPNGSDWPDIQNCIVYFNNDSGDQLAGMYPDDVAAYSCIQDCNELNGNINDFPGFAYTVEPNFVEPYLENYHLAFDSVCVDAENPNLVTAPDAQDIDGEDREYGGSVDMGADEAYSCDESLSEDDIYNALDWNADGIVNYEEFEYFSLAWLSRDPDEFADPNFIDPNEIANWDADCNLDASGDSQYVIDLADLEEFVENGYWLWTACWKQSRMDRYENMAEAMAMGGGESMMMPMSMESFTSVTVEQEALTLEEQAAQLRKTLDWLDEIWLDPSVQESIEEEDWLDFIGGVEGSLIDILEQQEE